MKCSKSALVYAACFLFFPLCIFAEKGNFKFSIEPSFGMRSGIFDEYVYDNSKTDGSEYYLSALEWNMKHSFYYGIDADACFKNFHVIAAWKQFIPNSFGEMTDSDFLQDYYYGTGRTDIKTNYSVHDNSLASGFNIGLTLKYDFYPVQILSISPVIELTFENYTFKAKNGTAYYGNQRDSSSFGSYYPYTDVNNRTVHHIPGDNIYLERNDFFSWIGAEAAIRTSNGRWLFSLKLLCSPYTCMYAHDSHLLRNLYFLDISHGIFSVFSAKTFAQFNITEHIGVRFSFSALISTEFQGKEYLSDSRNGTYKKTETKVGASSKYLDIKLSAVVSF